MPTHGHTRGYSATRIYRIWDSMKSRCLRPSHAYFPRYGGSGITICERWMRFENFLADMGEPPTDQHSIDRIDNDANYSPENCRWATPKEQSNNKRTCRYVEFRGDRITVAQFAERVGISYELATWRLIHRAWDPEKAARPVRAWTRKRSSATPPAL
jgi:hypothetical protein